MLSNAAAIKSKVGVDTSIWFSSLISDYKLFSFWICNKIVKMLSTIPKAPSMKLSLSDVFYLLQLFGKL